MAIDFCPREKNWKHVYTRSNKLHRANQLGFKYPRESESEMIHRESVKILFVCSMNKWRSPTAEKIYAQKPLVVTRSAGTSKNARRTVSSGDLRWADIVIVMEEKHRQRIAADYPGEMRYKKLCVLGIPDDYKFMDPELIDELRTAIEPILAGDAG